MPAADFTTAQRLDALTPPNVTADDAFLTFLFSRAPAKYDELKQKAAAQEPLPSFRLDGVRLTFNVDADYQVIRTQLTQNVIALVEGSDPQPGAEDDRIWNGADDDGSGTVALMALLKAFAEWPHPKRSLLFVWHAGEERGLLGSRYFADYPTGRSTRLSRSSTST